MRILLVLLLSLMSQCVSAQETGSGTSDVYLLDTTQISYKTMYYESLEEVQLLRTLRDAHQNLLEVQEQRITDLFFIMYMMVDATSEQMFIDAIRFIPVVVSEHKMMKDIADDDVRHAIYNLHEFYQYKKL